MTRITTNPTCELAARLPGDPLVRTSRSAS
jgi:hypothetical protein